MRNIVRLFARAFFVIVQVVLTGPVINMCGSGGLLMTVRTKAWARQLAVSTILSNAINSEQLLNRGFLIAFDSLLYWQVNSLAI